MILDRKEDKKGVYYRLGLINRAALTLENYAASQIGRRFYTEEFLQGLSERRNEIHARSAKATMSTLVAATALTFFDSLSGNVSLFGVGFSIPSAGAAALCVLVSLSLFGALLYQVDQLVIDRYISTLGNRMGMFSFDLTLLNYTAMNLWISALMPKHFGLASGVGHTLVAGLYTVLVLALHFIILAFPSIVVLFNVIDILSENPKALEVILCWLALFVLSLSMVFVLVFSVSYKFRPSGTSEPTDPFVPEDFLDLGHPRSVPNTPEE